MSRRIFYICCIVLLCSGSFIFAQGAVPHLYVLGIAQDGGYPHMGCNKKCCAMAWSNPALKKYVVSLALVDPVSGKWWLFEATPDIKEQLHYFQSLTKGKYSYLPAGIFLTHAHIGHYTGLVELGREVMNTHNVPVYVLPKMKNFLETNGPWSQLVSLQNISLYPLQADSPLMVAGDIRVTAFTVPHRDEYSETAGFRIATAAKTYLFIPDINKWEKWDRRIVDEVKSADVALLDGTFCNDTELPGRKMSDVPHPFVTETMQLFAKESKKTKSKVYFIHFNHTNPVLWGNERQAVQHAGFHVAVQGSAL